MTCFITNTCHRVARFPIWNNIFYCFSTNWLSNNVLGIIFLYDQLYDWASSPGVSYGDLRSPGPFSILEDWDHFPGHFPGKITHPLPAQHHSRKPPPPDLPWCFPGKLGLAETKSVCLPYAIKHCAYSRHIVARDFTESHKHHKIFSLFGYTYESHGTNWPWSYKQCKIWHVSRSKSQSTHDK